MSDWLRRALTRIHRLTATGHVRFTLKALHEIAELEPSLDELDALAVIRTLSGNDSAGRLHSSATGEWMYVFKPEVGTKRLYVKLMLRDHCIVISFHGDTEESSNDDWDNS